MDNPDLRARIVALEQTAQAKELRLSVLETWRIQRDIADARKDEQFTSMKVDLTSIKSTLSRIVWLLVTGLIGGFIAFVMKGGLNIP